MHLLVSRRMLFSTGFLFALLVSLSEARCRLGFSRRIDAVIYRAGLEGQNALAVIGTRGVATRKHKHSSGSFCVKGDVRLLRGPDAMEQNCQLACYRNNRLVLGLFAHEHPVTDI